MSNRFQCDKCGLCCRNLHLSSLYADLDDGTGKCMYLQGNLCSIYDIRPIICRIDDCYDLYFATLMSRDEYYRQNYAVCKKLKGEK